MNKFHFKKLRDVTSPFQAYEEAAAWDFFIPNSWDLLPGIQKAPEYIFPDWESKVIEPGTCLFVPSGLQISMPRGWALRFDNKSGKGRQGLLVGAQIVDRDYQGEIHLNVWNASNKSIVVKRGESILQGTFYQPEIIKLYEVHPNEKLFTEVSSRGTKGFGSSSKKH